MHTVLVTGAGGFIGSHLCRRLAADGHRVRGLLLPQEPGAGLQQAGVEVVRGDLLVPATLVPALEGVDRVIHLAARTRDWGRRRAFWSVIVQGTANLLAACNRDVKRLVYVSSIAALGLGRHLAGVDEDAPPRPCGIPYADAKAAAEVLVRRTCGQTGRQWVVARPANVFGPGSVWVTDVLAAFDRGPLPLIDHGRHPAALIFVDNLVDGLVAATFAPEAAGRTFHFCDDLPVTWSAYLQWLGSLAGKRPRGNLPFAVAWHLGAVVEAVCTPLGIRPPMTRLAAAVMGRNLAVSTRRTREELGWRPRVDVARAQQAVEAWVRRRQQAAGGRVPFPVR